MGIVLCNGVGKCDFSTTQIYWNFRRGLGGTVARNNKHSSLEFNVHPLMLLLPVGIKMSPPTETFNTLIFAAVEATKRTNWERARGQFCSKTLLASKAPHTKGSLITFHPKLLVFDQRVSPLKTDISLLSRDQQVDLPARCIHLLRTPEERSLYPTWHPHLYFGHYKPVKLGSADTGTKAGSSIRQSTSEI